MSDAVRAAYAQLSREFWLVCEPGGTVREADPRAELLLGLRAGQSLHEFAVPGTEAKLARLLAQAGAGPVDRWELVLSARGRPVTVSVHGGPHAGGGLFLLGSLVPEDYGQALGEVNAALSELAALHRETARQRRELEERHAQILKLNGELSDSDRGVVQLHAELREKNDSLRVVAESRSRLVANVSHELRTPLNSILGLSRLLLTRADGELNDEQEKQIGFIRRSAETLSELVNDLLDMSKMEAGKLVLRPSKFTAGDVFSSLRGMMRPLLPNDGVSLHFDQAPDLPVMDTDEAKLSQILRNLISNAIKFTERGEVRVGVRAADEGWLRFEVSDTGIGIAPDDQTRVFEEFTQIDNPIQRRVKGSGLGLSLSRRLAVLLGGELSLRSEPGRGSTFTLRIPVVHPDVRELNEMRERSEVLDPMRSPVLVLEDDSQTLFLYEKYLAGSGFQVVPARTVDDARAALQRFTPAAVVLDVMLDGETSWGFLSEMKNNPRTRDVPALVVTVTSREQKARALGADEFYVKPIEQQWLLKRLQAMARRGPVEKILVIDDDEVARYLVKKMLEGSPYEILEASSGAEGVAAAQSELPHVILLDFVMPGMSAFEVLDELKANSHTRNIPVIIHTSANLQDEERRRLEAETAAIISKQGLSREVAIARIRDALAKAGLQAGL